MSDTEQEKATTLKDFSEQIQTYLNSLDSDIVAQERKAVLSRWSKIDSEIISNCLMNFDSLVFALTTLEMTKELDPRPRQTVEYIPSVPVSVTQELTPADLVPPVLAEPPEEHKEKPQKRKRVRDDEFHAKETMIIPLKDELLILREREEFLYRDIFRLLELGDVNGALISLERLITIAPRSERVKEFLKVNADKIRELYQERFGNFDRVPNPAKNEVKIDLKHFPGSKFQKILDIVDSHNTINDIIENSKFSLIDVCSSINQLIRLGYIELI
jgi:hypothetical protein